MTSLWASISPLNQDWSRNPFTIRITHEAVDKNSLKGIRLLIVGHYTIGEEIIVSTGPTLPTLVDDHSNAIASLWPEFASLIPKPGVYSLILHLKLLNLPGYSAPYQRLELVTADDFPRRSGKELLVLFDHTFPINTTDKQPLEIVLARYHQYRMRYTMMYDSWWRTRSASQGITIRILDTDTHPKPDDGSTQLIHSLPPHIIQSIARNLLNDVTPEQRLFPSWLLSMALTQKSWLHVLDEFTWFIEQPILFRNSKMLPSLLEKKPSWKTRIRTLHDASFFLPSRWKDANLKMERWMFILSIHYLSDNLERLEIDIESMLSLSESGVSDKVSWNKLRNLRIEGAQQSGDREELGLDDLAHALRLFPGLKQLSVSGLVLRDEQSSPEALSAPTFILESLALYRGKLDCRDLRFLFPLSHLPGSVFNLTTLIFNNIRFRAPGELAHLFAMTSSTLRDLILTITEDFEKTEELAEVGPSLLDQLPATMEKLRSIRVTAGYVTPGIIRNMLRSRRTGCGDERTYLELSYWTSSDRAKWEGGKPAGYMGDWVEEEATNDTDISGGARDGRELSEAVEVTEWDEIVFSGVYLAYGRSVKRLEAVIGKIAKSRGYTIIKSSTELKMTRAQI